MEYNSIADIYSANNKIADGMAHTVATITAAEADAEIEGEKWTVAALVEHVAIVESNMAKLCSKLLAGAKQSGKMSDGSFALSPELAAKFVAGAEAKIEAPEFVRPQGGVAIAESIEKLNKSATALDALRPDFETVDVSDTKFPHPFFGDLTAAEWLLLSGGHKMRHIKQIERLLLKVRQ